MNDSARAVQTFQPFRSVVPRPANNVVKEENSSSLKDF